MRTLFRMALVLLIFSSLQNTATCDEGSSESGGLSVVELREFANSLPDLPGRIQAIRLFRESGGQRSSVAVATWAERSGWQIFVFNSPSGKKFQLEWTSGKLDDTFTVSSFHALEIFDLGTELGVSFYGCAPHLCGGGVFSVLLYVPSKRTAFTARYVHGKVTYSPGLESPENSSYKSALDQLVKEQTE